MYAFRLSVRTPTNDLAISDFEQRTGFALPKDYRAFLLHTNGGQPDLNAFPVMDYEDSVEILNQFSGLGTAKPSSDIAEDHEFFAGRVPDGLIVIGHTDGGGHLCLDLRGGRQKVMFWDHRHFWSTGEWREKDLYHVADTFDELIAAMRRNPYA
jgi:hypothetical protein